MLTVRRGLAATDCHFRQVFEVQGVASKSRKDNESLAPVRAGRADAEAWREPVEDREDGASGWEWNGSEPGRGSVGRQRDPVYVATRARAKS